MLDENHSFAIIRGMDLQTYIETTGVSLSDLAAGVGASRNLAYQWVKKIRPVAPHWCWPIEAFTEGKVTRAELRPNDWQSLWPDLSGRAIDPRSRPPRKPPTVPT